MKLDNSPEMLAERLLGRPFDELDEDERLAMEERWRTRAQERINLFSKLNELSADRQVLKEASQVP